MDMGYDQKYTNRGRQIAMNHCMPFQAPNRRREDELRYRIQQGFATAPSAVGYVVERGAQMPALEIYAPSSGPLAFRVPGMSHLEDMASSTRAETFPPHLSETLEDLGDAFADVGMVLGLILSAAFVGGCVAAWQNSRRERLESTLTTTHP
jgi:hypothetical protein